MAVAKAELAGLDGAWFRAVAKMHHPTRRNGREDGGKCLVGRNECLPGGNLDRQSFGGIRHRGRKPEFPLGPSSFEALDVNHPGREVQRRKFIGGKARVTKVVVVRKDPVSELGGRVVERQGFHREGKTQLPQSVFVTLELTTERSFVVGVSRYPLAKLIRAEQTLSVEQCCGQVEKTFDTTHAVPA